MEDKIKCEFTGIVMYKYYYLMRCQSCDYVKNEYYYSDKPYIYTDFHRDDKTKIFHSCEIDRPPFNRGETVYIPELDLTLSICETIRSTDGTYRFATNYVIEKIENDKTIESLKKANEDLEKELVKYEEQLKPKKKWYQF